MRDAPRSTPPVPGDGGAALGLLGVVPGLLGSLPGGAADPSHPLVRLLSGPTGLGTSSLRSLHGRTPGATAPGGDRPPCVPTGSPRGDPAASGHCGTVGSSKARIPELYCPDALRDDPALGDAVDDRLVRWWGEEIDPDASPDQLGRMRDAGFGRLMMLCHPDSDDVDRLAAAGMCAVAEWAVDDLYQDGDEAEPEPEKLGPRLALAYGAMSPARLPPPPYLSQYEEVLRGDRVLRAIRSSWTNLARYGTSVQVFRLRHELAIMFVAYNQEAQWQITRRMPPVWEFLLHRWENAFCPCMVLTDVVGGYEVPPHEYFDPRVRRVVATAGVCSVLVNDIHSLDKEERINELDYSMPRVLMAEDGCSLQEAVDRTADFHDELMRYVEAESAALAAAGTPLLGRFLAGLWAWMGGGKTWHASSKRYHPDPVS
ncbi:family 2 encapsulin nanocompartment cargo protein terpene cyclase [Streptomyces sp. NPDC050504]|uniref:family 2 encapsulin nanocompartment cargo protein terpene cyclase n=1 Tax=Streptomyces sp. NPDC050504 TaxID=3365618 RepID=UPI0037909143